MIVFWHQDTVILTAKKQIKDLELGEKNTMNNTNTYSISSLGKIDSNTAKKNFSIFQEIQFKFQNFLTTICAPIVAGKEPKLWLSFDGQGNCYWNAYDPQSNRYARNLSEAEMRVWLEERY